MQGCTPSEADKRTRAAKPMQCKAWRICSDTALKGYFITGYENIRALCGGRAKVKP